MICTVKIVTLGCPKNLVDSRQIKGYLIKEGYSLVDDVSEARVIIVNTCGFIEDAKRESIETIIEMLQYKENGTCKYLVVAGCLAQKYVDELTREIPEIDAIVGTGDIPIIPKVLSGLDFKQQVNYVGNPNSFLYNLDLPQMPSETEHYAYLKIAEGCDNACSYCVIPAMRGSYRSRKMEEIIQEANNLVKQGIKEIILIAQDTTLYGYDLYGKLELPNLLQELARIEGIRWIRILYSYPNNITDELLYTIKKEKKICSYLDIPLQHISDSVLGSMGRPMTRKETENLILRIRRIIPEIILRSTFIIGFPGETKEDFAELLSFINKTKFERAGFFAYSREPGTRAAILDRQVSTKEKERRLENITTLQKEILSVTQASKIGQEVLILVDGPSNDYEGLWEGRTEGDAPEIDGVVYFESKPGLLIGDFVYVKITHSQEFALVGEIKNEFS